MTTARRSDLVFFGLACAVLALLLIWPLIDTSLGGDHYIYLARHFASGNVNVDDLSPLHRDYVAWNGHKYIPFGPLPAVLLIPFLPLIRIGMPMVIVSYILTAINVIVFYRLLALVGVTGERRKWITLLYFGGTVYLSITLSGISTFFAHVTATTFCLLAIWEMVGKRRLVLVGLYLGLAGASRLTLIFALPFFLWLLKYDDTSSSRESNASRSSDKIGASIFALLVGLGIPMLALAAYNYARFGSFLESGFALSRLYGPTLEKARAAGLFSVVHMPKNLFMMLLQGPQVIGGDGTPVLKFPYFQPSPWGMGMFFTTPALVYVFFANRKDKLVQACWLAVIAVMIPVITYYGIGVVQFGYRYSLDFMPFLILLAARAIPEPLSVRARALITASVLINIWGAIWLAVWI